MKRKTRRKIGKFLEKAICGHISIGKRLTVYGDNAMRFGVNYWTRKYGYICFRLPLFCGIADYFLYGDKIKWYPLYLYCSPNATPWAATFMLGKKGREDDWALARVRRRRLGHNFSTNDEYQYKVLREINNIV